jgi:hypothetical protein
METNANRIEGGEIMSTDLSRRDVRRKVSAELAEALIDVGFSDPAIISDMVLLAMISMATQPYCPLCHHDAENIPAHIREVHSA